MGFVPKPVRFSATFTGFVALNMSIDNLQVYNIVAGLRGFATLRASTLAKPPVAARSAARPSLMGAVGQRIGKPRAETVLRRCKHSAFPAMSNSRFAPVGTGVSGFVYIAHFLLQSDSRSRRV